VLLTLLFASAGVMHHSSIKVPFFSFFAHDSGKRPKEAPLHMLLAMGGAAILCIAIGVYPQPLHALLPYPVSYESYTTTHVVTQLQLLMFSALAFTAMMKSGIYPPELRSTNLDFDWIYRRALPWAWARVQRHGGQVWNEQKALGVWAVQRALAFARANASPHTPLGEPWLTGRSALWAAVLLLGLLALSFL
jgi:multicomponent Na+:H+ antiporter subunit D